MKKQIWFQTDLGYEATRQKLVQQKTVIGDMQPSKGRLTFYFKDMKDFTVQITTQGKLGIFYPETSDYNMVLEKLQPYLVKADGSQAKILREIRISKKKLSTEEKSSTEKSKFSFWEWLKDRSERKRLEESRCFKPEYLPLVESIYKEFELAWLKPFIEHDKELEKKLENLSRNKEIDN